MILGPDGTPVEPEGNGRVKIVVSVSPEAPMVIVQIGKETVAFDVPGALQFAHSVNDKALQIITAHMGRGSVREG